MNRSEFILGIAISILGGSIMLASLISGIFHFSEKLYQNFRIFNIALQSTQAPLKTSFFSVKEGQIFSVWLRYSNSRQTENTNLKIAVSLIDEDGYIAGKFLKEFWFGPFRNSARKVRYDKLGEYHLKNNFRGYLQYELAGTWIPTKASALVLRQSPPLRLPLKPIGFFLASLFVLFFGIEKVTKHYKNQKTDRRSSPMGKDG